MTINDRVQEIIDTLFSGNKRAFSRAVGIAATVTENVVGKRHTKPSFDFTQKIATSINNINIEWLITGEGLMFNPSPSLNGENLVGENQLNKQSKNLINGKPFLDSKLINSRNFLSASEESDKQISLPFIPDYDFSLCNYGDSMSNNKNPKRSINDGDIVACKFWENNTYIRWGEVYAILTSEGYIIKKIIKSENEGYIKCVSFNEEKGYTPYEMPVTEVMDWAIVVGVVSTSAWQ